MFQIAKMMLIGLAGTAFLLALAVGPRVAAPIRVMILDGESGGPYHQWKLVTAVLKKELDEAGLFQLDSKNTCREVEAL
jgi:hypothetical protein